MITAYVLFFIAGVGFGYAAAGVWKWLPLGFPIGLFLIAAFMEGVDGTAAIRLIVALVITAAGVLLVALRERRGERSERARYA